MERENNKKILCSLSKGRDHKITFVPSHFKTPGGREGAGTWRDFSGSHCEVSGLLSPLWEGFATQSLEKALRALELNQEKAEHTFWQALTEAESKVCKGIQQFVPKFSAVPHKAREKGTFICLLTSLSHSPDYEWKKSFFILIFFFPPASHITSFHPWLNTPKCQQLSSVLTANNRQQQTHPSRAALLPPCSNAPDSLFSNLFTPSRAELASHS